MPEFPPLDSEALITRDCDAIADMGFDTMVLNVTHVVNESTGEVQRLSATWPDFRNMALMVMALGARPWLVMDMTVSPDGDPSKATIDPQAFARVPQEVFQPIMTSLAVDAAAFAEQVGIPLFAPTQEMNAILPGDTAGSEFGQAILPELRAVYSGQLTWLAAGPDYDIKVDWRGYDLAGFHLSPLQGELVDQFTQRAERGLERLEEVCTRDAIPTCLISSLGIWGNAMDDPTWANAPLNAFEGPLQATLDAGAPGVFVFDGPTSVGDFNLASDPEVVDYIRDWMAAFP